jgi:tellurite resistance protein TerC
VIVGSTESAGDLADLGVPFWGWAAFLTFIVALLLFDLLVLHREAHVPTFRRAAIESAAWIGIGLAFGLVLLFLYDGQAASEYYAGYLIEKSLSIDNVFVWALIFTYFAVPRLYQHRVLFWGIFAALVLRAIFIFAGVALIEQFSWVLYVFGVFLLYTAGKLLFTNAESMDPGKSRLLRLARRVIPSTDEYHGQKLWIRDAGRLLATPLFFVLIVIEVSDVIFAVDSVPAILAVSRDQFIVFSSNAMAILGLRALYFLLADLHSRFHYLQMGLAVILAFVGVKMILAQGIPDSIGGDSLPSWLRGFHIPTGLSLAFIAAVLAVSIIASLMKPQDDDDSHVDQQAADAEPT